MRRIFAVGMCLGVILLTADVYADGQSIGVYTGVYGTVTATHVATREPLRVKVQDDVQFQDRIETESESQMRALLDDDTLLSLGENSQLEITEHIYQPKDRKRIAVLNLVHGTVRALVSKMPGAGSKFEIHTPSGIAAARGTYFVVWVESDGQTGVANIGDEGNVAFISNGEEILVRPGQSLLSLPRPTLVSTGGQEPAAKRAIRSTEVRDNIAVESPQKTLRALGGIIVKDLPVPARSVGAFVGNSPMSPAQNTGDSHPDPIPIGPPAVISGAIKPSSGSSFGSSSPGSSFSNLGPGSNYSNSGPGSISSGRSGSRHHR